ncbi:unnamed protein product, partial [Closterium sp. Naga37s-1]
MVRSSLDIWANPPCPRDLPPSPPCAPPAAICCCPCRDVSFNFLRDNVDTWASPLKLSTNLLSLRLNNNYLYGSVPLWLVSFAKLTNLELSMNALTGTFPAPISTALKRLMVDQNFLGGTFPANGATFCMAYYNCLANYITCPAVNPSLSIPSYGCQFCGLTNALGTACMGNPCVPITPAPITAVNKWSPVPVMRCDPVPVQASQDAQFILSSLLPVVLAAVALAAMAPGLWTQATVVGQAYIPGTLPSLFCNPSGNVLDMYAPSLLAPSAHPSLRAASACPAALPLTPPLNLTFLGYFPADASKLTALTNLDLSSNLFSLCLDNFLAPFIPLKSLIAFRLQQNYFSGSFPANISALTALTELRVNMNYLTGSLPAALPASLNVVDVSSNYLVGTFPTTTATAVACASNCLQDASKCPAGSAQRTAAASAICQTADGTGRLCGGGVCSPNATERIAAKLMNFGESSLYCVGASMDPAMGECIRGWWHTTWVGALPWHFGVMPLTPFTTAMMLPHSHPLPRRVLLSCPVAALPLAPHHPPLPLPPGSGGAAEHEAVGGGDGHGLGGGCAVHHLGAAAARKCNLRSNLLEGRLDVFAANFKVLTSLKEAYLDFNWFTGPIPSTLVTITTLSSLSVSPLLAMGLLITPPILYSRASTLNLPCPPFCPPFPTSLARSGASYNYLYGAVPAPGAALKAIALDGNWLSGTFPGTGFSSCSATANCLASSGACTTGGTVQRTTAACAVCDTTDGSTTVCGGSTYAPDTTAPLGSGTPNSATAAVLPRFCVGVALDATQGNVLLVRKASLGATFSDWTAATLAALKATPAKPKAQRKRRVLQARGAAAMQYEWKVVGSCTIQGQTPIAGVWTSMRYSPLGQILSLRLASNLLFARLDSYVVPITPTATLKELSVPPLLRLSHHPSLPSPFAL